MQISLKDVENASVAGTMSLLTLTSLARLLGIEVLDVLEYLYVHYHNTKKRVATVRAERIARVFAKHIEQQTKEQEGKS